MAAAGWGPRLEEPEGLAKRAHAMFKRLQAVDPVFTHWYTWNKQEGFKPFDLSLDRIAEEIAAGVSKDDNGGAKPQDGYLWDIYNSPNEKHGPRDFYIGLGVGSDRGRSFGTNTVHLATRPYRSIAPDPSITTFNIMKSALLALAEPFEATYAQAYLESLSEFWSPGHNHPPLHIAWISYLAPRFALLITPPPTAIVEYQPDGSLVMAATEEAFNLENPAHIAAARDIEIAVAPFNALPWPGDPRL